GPGARHRDDGGKALVHPVSCGGSGRRRCASYPHSGRGGAACGARVPRVPAPGSPHGFPSSRRPSAVTTTAGGLRIRHANADDVPAYASFSRRLVIETFAGKNDPLEFAAYLEGSFGEARQAAELADPGTTVLLGEIEGEIAAFAYMRDGVTPECVTGPNPMEIARFYVDGRWHGRGLARTMMQAAAREAVRRGA